MAGAESVGRKTSKGSCGLVVVGVYWPIRPSFVVLTIVSLFSYSSKNRDEKKDARHSGLRLPSFRTKN